MATIDAYLERLQIITEAILEANKQAEPTDVKGAPYIAVHERVKAFRKVFPFGRIETNVKVENGVCTCTAEIYVLRNDIVADAERADMPVLIATGTAVEKDGSSYINKTSFVENCETSAVGRALGFAGFGIDTAIASSDEVQNAELQDISKQKIGDIKLKALENKCRKEHVDEAVLLRLYKLKTLADMTEKQYSNCVEFWDKIKAIRGNE
jgi:hypothetical protein